MLLVEVKRVSRFNLTQINHQHILSQGRFKNYGQMLLRKIEHDHHHHFIDILLNQSLQRIRKVPLSNS